MRSIVCGLVVVFAALWGCHDPREEKVYPVEEPALALPGTHRQTWALAPVVNLSGQRGVDPLLQADVLYNQLQQVAGLNVIPVNRVADVYAALRMTQVRSEKQAQVVCELLDCDALLVATVTIYDPYDPPKMGASLQLFGRGDFRLPPNVDPRELARLPAPATQEAPPPAAFVQVVGEFDAANGSTRAQLMRFAGGRADPSSPLREKRYLLEMDLYAGFVYHELLAQLLQKPALARAP